MSLWRRGAQAAAAVATACALIGLGEACGDDVERGTADAGPRSEASVDAALDGDAAASPYTLPAMRAAADAFNAKYCPAFQRCDPVAFRLAFGAADGMATCMKAGGLVLIPVGEERFFDDLAAPYAYRGEDDGGARLTPDELLRCADALDFAPGASCEAWVRFASAHEVPDACRAAFFGHLADDEPCGAWNQCASGRCMPVDEAAHGACGRCAARLPPNVSCRLDPGNESGWRWGHACEKGTTCRPQGDAGAKCVRYGDEGAACVPNAPGRLTPWSTPLPCRDDLVCVSNDAGAAACARPPPDGGCDPAVGCSAVPGHHACNPGSGRCEAETLAKLDGGCGYISPVGDFVACDHGLTCMLVGVDQYRCDQVVEHGRACTATPHLDNHCRSPDDRCFRDSCQRNGPAECAKPRVLP